MAQQAVKFVKLQDYLAWANAQGCRIQTGFIVSGSEQLKVTVVTAPSPSKRYAVIHDVEDDEALPLQCLQERMVERRRRTNDPRRRSPPPLPPEREGLL